jgi:hypothetical protein
MSLDGDQVRKLHDSIVDHFDPSELTRLVRFDLGQRLEDITAASPFPEMVLNLIEWADRQGRTADLIQAVQRARPNVPEIQAIAEALLAAGDRSTGRPRSPLIPKQGDRNRSAMIEKVRAIWITGFLQDSLFHGKKILLGLRERPDVVGRRWDALARRQDENERSLPLGTQIVEAFDKSAQALLILGKPGSGKTTLLLELASVLLDRAERDLLHPIPVVFPLSPWAASRKPLVDRKPLVEWLVEELNFRYDVPRKVGQEWAESDQILPLLDGLDEVKEEQRVACVEAINEFRESHGLLPLVITSRTVEFEALSKPPRLHGEILVEPLTQDQVKSYLADLGSAGEPVRTAIQGDLSLWKLQESPDGLDRADPGGDEEDSLPWKWLDTPLLLNVVTLAYAGQTESPTLLSGTVAERRDHLFGLYVNQMLGRRTADRRYSPEKMIHWLSWLAYQMNTHGETVFYLERLQTDWLPQRQGLAIRVSYGVLLGMVYGLVGALAFWHGGGLVVGVIVGLVAGAYEMRGVLTQGVRRSAWNGIGLRVGGGLAVGLVFGLVAGLGDRRHLSLFVGPVVGLAFGLVSGMRWPEVISRVETVHWSWPQLWHSLCENIGMRLFLVLVGVLVVGPVGGLVYGLLLNGLS